MVRKTLFALAALVPCSLAHAGPQQRPISAYDEEISRHAEMHGVPERLVHRVVMRESRYQPHLVHNRCYGLMQIKYATARSMGYNGSEKGLLDPHVNLTYAIPYLANAYHIAGGDEDRAVTLFAAGYYFTAKNKNMLSALRTATSAPFKARDPAAPQPAPAPNPNPLMGLALLLSDPGQPPAPAARQTFAGAPSQDQAAAAGLPPASAGQSSAPAASEAPASASGQARTPAAGLAYAFGYKKPPTAALAASPAAASVYDSTPVASIGPAAAGSAYSQTSMLDARQ